eukprot:COSAG03_NODE_38_length_17530_cov_148.572223_13_plen_74_part_00
MLSGRVYEYILRPVDTDDVASGQSTKALLGHTDLVDRCSVFVKNGITYGTHGLVVRVSFVASQHFMTRVPLLC